MNQDRRMPERSKKIFDVTETFNQALSRARLERGEPEEGLARTFYNARRWTRINSRRTLLAGVALTIVGVGAISYFVRQRREPEIEEMEESLRARRAA